MFTYKTNGTCSVQIDLEIQDGVITYCKFTRHPHRHAVVCIPEEAAPV